MGTIRIWSGNGRKARTRSYEFTVVVLPIYETDEVQPTRPARRKGRALRKRNPVGAPTGYQLTVPILPGLITFGRTPEEAREMVADAIKVHLEGLKKSGEPIPDERNAQLEKVRFSIPA
jgi:predicted RNase H-like HicB family nuclease